MTWSNLSAQIAEDICECQPDREWEEAVAFTARLAWTRTQNREYSASKRPPRRCWGCEVSIVHRPSELRYCESCAVVAAERRRARDAAWHSQHKKQNRAKYNAYAKADYQRNRAKRLAACKDYYQRNRAKIMARVAAYKLKQKT